MLSELLAVWVTLAPWFFGIAGLLLFGVLTLAAVLLQAWPLGLLAALMLAAGLWNLRTGFRIRAAQARGAAPVSPRILDGSRHGRGYTAAAKQVVGSQTRDGVVVIVDGVAAFVPRTGWYGVAVGALSAASVLAVTEVLMMDVPQSVEVLRGLVASTDGFYLDRRSWAWSTRGQFLTCVDPPSMVSVRLPQPHSDMWADRPATPQQRTLLRTFAVVGAVLFAVFLGGGVLGWRVTGDTDHLISGGWFAAMVLIVAAGVYWKAPRARG